MPTFPAEWRAEWIWHPGRADPVPPSRFGGKPSAAGFDEKLLFRRDFSLAVVPDAAMLRLTSNSRHILFVNGREILRGPIRSSSRTLYFDEVDVSEHLVQGTNAIAVLVRYYGFATSWWEPTPLTGAAGAGGLLLELSLGDEVVGIDALGTKGPGTEAIATDAHWRVVHADAWRPQRPRDELSPQIPEVFDARKLDADWTTAPSDGWPAAAALTTSQLGRRPSSRPPSEPYSSIEHNPLTIPRPQRREPQNLWREKPSGRSAGAIAAFAETLSSLAERVVPIELPAPSSVGDTLVIDFGKIVSGTVSFALEAAAGARVAVTLIETPESSALDSANYIEYTARRNDDRYESLESMGGRYALIAVLEGDLVITDVAVTERLRPRPQATGFSCDDEALNRLYSVAVRTVDLCSRDAYMDCPTREQRAWVGDSIIHQSVDLTCNPNWELAIHNVRLLAQPRSDGLLPMVAAGDFSSPDLVTIPDASLHWTRTVHNLYQYTGDRDLVAGLMPAFESVLRWFASFHGEDGLVQEVPGWVLIDWAPTEVDGTVAALNGLWGRALVDFAEISDWLGDRGRAVWARGLHERLREGFEKFWDPDREVYVDSIRNGERSRRLSEHAHAAAVVGGLVPEHRFTRVAAVLLDRQHIVDPTALLADNQPSTFFRDTLALRQQPNWDVERDLVAAQPYFRYIVHDALAALGRADAIADLLHDWDALLLTGPSALREVWRGQSYAHAWSATPARDLVKHVAGISPGSPGYDTVTIAPRPGPLTRLSVSAPSPHGLIRMGLADEQLSVTSPRPVTVLHPDRSVTELPAGDATLAWPNPRRTAQ